MENKLVVVRGGGDIATGTIAKLFNTGFSVIILEIDKPTVIRRTVSFAQAVYDGEAIVEGIKAVKARTPEEAVSYVDERIIPVLVDASGVSIDILKPIAVIDAILAKKNIGTNINMAEIVIGLGPGFEAGKDVHAVIETNRGHNLGKVIYNGTAEANTGIPGNVGGFTSERVFRAPSGGIVKNIVGIGEMVNKNDIIAYVDNTEVRAPLDGVVRGLIQEGLEVPMNFKIGDVDPRGIKEYCFTISDKGRAIGGGVLEALLHLAGKEKSKS